MPIACRPLRRVCNAFTLVELLVVIAIIGVLIGLLLPAVQAARESARRSNCTNNLKQVGLAIHSFESAMKRLPAGHRVQSSGSTQPSWGWAVFILPYAEQTALYETLDPVNNTPQGRITSNLKVSLADPVSVAMQTKIPMYRCPTDTSPDLNTLEDFGSLLKCATGTDPALATSNYVGSNGGYTLVSGSWQNFDPKGTDDPGGVFYGFADTRLGTPLNGITDGLSKTFAVGERCGAASQADALAGNGQYAAVWLGHGKASLAGTTSLGRLYGLTTSSKKINLFGGAVTGASDVGKYFSSRHSGGAQFLFCDGSIQFFSETTDPSTILCYLGNRADGQTVSW